MSRGVAYRPVPVEDDPIIVSQPTVFPYKGNSSCGERTL